jgi:hypothetical protein
MPTIHIDSEQELKELFLELAHIGHNMRFAQKYWHVHFGYQAKQKKELWEKKFDALLNRLNMAEHQNTKAILVIKQP